MELLADARSTDYLIRELQSAADEGMAIVASSPFRFRHRAGMRRMSDLVDPLDRALRSTRVLVRHTAVAAYHRRQVPHAYALLAARPRRRLRPGGRRAHARTGWPCCAQDAVLAVGAATGQVDRADDLSAEAILAQLRSVVTDLLLLTGMEPLEATDSLPRPPGLREVPATDGSALVGAARRPRPVHRRRRDPATPRARGPAGGGRRPRGPDRAGRGLHRVVRRPGVRRRVRDAAAGGPAQDPGRGLPARRRPGVRRGLGGRDGHPAVAGVGRGAGAARGARLGRGVPRAGTRARRPGRPGRVRGGDPRRGAGRDPAALLGRHRRQQAPGQDRHRLRQAARAPTGSATTPGSPRWGSGPPTRCGASAARPPRSSPPSASTRCPSSPPPTPAVLAAELGPTMGPWYRRLGRGVDSSPVDPTPYVPRAHGRETTFQADLEDWTRVADEVRALTARVVADIDAEGRPAERVGLKVRFKPFITVSRSLTLPAPDQRPRRAGRRRGVPARPARRARPWSAGAAARRTARDGAEITRYLVNLRLPREITRGKRRNH